MKNLFFAKNFGGRWSFPDSPLTTLEDSPLRSFIYTRDDLADLGEIIAEQDRVTTPEPHWWTPSPTALANRFKENVAFLEQAYKTLLEDARQKAQLHPGADWILDNYHIIDRHISEIRKFFPRGYARTLPQLKEGELRGFPRAYRIALEIITHTDALLDTTVLSAFVEAYQRKTPLTTGEIWAIPIMLKFALLENLRRLTASIMVSRDERLLADELVRKTIDKLSLPAEEAVTRPSDLLLWFATELRALPPLRGPGIVHIIRRLRERATKMPSIVRWYEERLREEGIDADEKIRHHLHRQAQDQVSIGNTITSLRSISATSWMDWFESISLVHRELLKDPSGIYEACDFKTRDRYRQAIERLAKKAEISELVVARKCLELATLNNKQTHNQQELHSIFLKDREPNSHVGYYLVNAGRSELVRALSLSPSPFDTWVKTLKQHRFLAFASTLAFAATLIALLAAVYARQNGSSLLVTLMVFGIFIIPGSEIALMVLQWIVSHIVPPRALPKLSFEHGVPLDCRTLVVVHGIFSSPEQLAEAIEGLEVRFLANDMSNIHYSLLADLSDSSSISTQTDEAIMVRAQREIARLNATHDPASVAANAPRFSAFFRKRVWNESEQTFMCWERKRGKITELNRLILGHRSSADTTFLVTSQEQEFLRTFRFVITLDGDSFLSQGGAHKLIGTLAHPLNRPRRDHKSGLVTSGYGILQPRVNYSLTSAHATYFARSFCGQAGLDPYTNLTSDFYMDVFGEASFVGKGIYDVEAFELSLDDRVPENALLSHDLFESNCARVGLATDIEVYDDYPSRFTTYSQRLHRWVRGDWQLLPWLRASVPNAKGERIPNFFKGLSYWKILDNLRRSLVAPFLLLIVILSWTILPGSVLFWLSFVLFVLAFPVYTNVAHLVVVPPLGFSLSLFVKGFAREIGLQLTQTFTLFAFLPTLGLKMVHAITITLHRVLISHQHLLEWRTASQAEKDAKKDVQGIYRQMLPGITLAAVAALTLPTVSGSRLLIGLSTCAIWLLSPFFEKFLAESPANDREELADPHNSYLYGIAYDTWRYFRDLLKPEYNYLIPDNLQIDPSRVVAERTSSTNIGFSLVAVISAYELGFEPLPKAIDLLERIVRSTTLLERHHGHLLNWYSITDMNPLPPKYVSSVDSGNLVASLFVTTQALEEYFRSPLTTEASWLNLRDRVQQFIDSDPRRLSPLLASFASAIAVVPSNTIAATASRLSHISRQFSNLNSALGAELSSNIPELGSLIEILPLLEWAQIFSNHPIIVSLRQDKSDPGESIRFIESSLQTSPPSLASLELVLIAAEQLLESIRSLRHFGSDTINSLARPIAVARERLKEIESQRTSAIEKSKRLAEETNFNILYDSDKHLFAVGYNVDNARMDRSFYDMLASEARLTSFVAIAKGDLPVRHWFTLGRTLVESGAGKCLASWSGTMFEYLMPLVYMRDFPTTLLAETNRTVVAAQARYGHSRQVPWGISESAYSRVDYHSTYQYRAFGVPGLGLKRGLEDDLVISPYSTLLATLVAPQTAINNARALERVGARGEYGFFEALDYTASRLAPEERVHVVKAFFAHHQGMILGALANVLTGGIIHRRFHQDPRVQANELLLHERFPTRIPFSQPPRAGVGELERKGEEGVPARGRIITTPHTQRPITHILSNRRLASMIDNAGSGYTSLDRDIAITRWREDPVNNRSGLFIYVRDLETSNVWSTAYQPTCVDPELYEVFVNLDKVEFKRRDHRILLQTEITVAQEDDVEIRRVTITNLLPRKRVLDLTSFGEVVLGNQRADAVHPAFSKMFIESEFNSDLDTLIFTRRRRSVSEVSLFLFHTISLRACWDRTQYETSRVGFIGRGRDLRAPLAFAQDLAGTTGIVLDPVMSLRARVELPPNGSEIVTFVTGVAKKREDIEHIAAHYREPLVVNRAFELSWSQSTVELRNGDYSVAETHLFQTLGNAILFSFPMLRGSDDALARNRLTQQALWRFGVSGDSPIVLLRLNDPSHIALARQCLIAHRYLRNRGLAFDLVILNDYEGGYLQDFHHELDSLIRSGDNNQWVDRKGGLILRLGSHLSPEEKMLLSALCRVSLEGAKGDLADQIPGEELLYQAVSQPPVVLSPSENITTTPERPPELEFATPLGGFSNDGRSYAITVRNKTLPPVPWSNVIANKNFGTLITESGGGYTWAENSRENRLTPWSNDPVLDTLGEAIYLRDPATGAYWSPTPKPILNDTTYISEHSFGFSTFRSAQRGIQSKLTILVGPEEPVKWWNLELTNLEGRERTLEVYLYVEWVLGVLREDSYRTVVTHFDEANQTLTAENHYNNEFAHNIVFVGSNLDIASFTTDRLEFIGRNRDLSCPIHFQHTSPGRTPTFRSNRATGIPLSDRMGAGLNACGVIKVTVTLEPHSTRQALFFMAKEDSAEQMRSVVTKYRSSKHYELALQSTVQFWDELTSTIKVSTPDRKFDVIMNGWLLYQAASCRLWGRTGFYQSGGAFGFRDQLQDAIAFLPISSTLAREQILLHASRQFVEGDVQHWWHPPTGRGVRTKITDDFLWLPYAVARYVETTGDTGILDEQASYIEGPLLNEHMEAYIIPHTSSQSGSIYDHCLRALDRALGALSPRGLPLIGAGDWNDGMNEVGKDGMGESIWLGWFLSHCLDKFQPIVGSRDGARAGHYAAAANDLVQAIEEHAWDGSWYRRAYFDDGTPLGSSENEECKIDSIAQSWAIISGRGNPERTKVAIEEVYNNLVDKENRIIRLLTPPFHSSHLEPGYIKGYVPGVRENGGQYTHAAAWLIIATAMMGNGDRAAELFDMVNPISHAASPELVAKYQGEPYVLCGDVYGTFPHEGRAGWSWYTGSASWAYQAGLEYILGFRLFPNHIAVKPCIPTSWKEYTITFRREGTTYRIRVENPNGVNSGVIAVWLDGEQLASSEIPLSRNAGEKEVRIVMG